MYSTLQVWVYDRYGSICYKDALGWTVFDNLYVANGTVFVVTDNPEIIPPRDELISTGIELKNDPESVAARLPTNQEMRIISVEEARNLFGDGATLIDGVTVCKRSWFRWDFLLIPCSPVGDERPTPIVRASSPQ